MMIRYESAVQRLYERTRKGPFIQTAKRETKGSTPYVPTSLTAALWIAMGVVVAVTLTGITALFLVGFQVPGFVLDPIVLASLVGGMSIQSAAAIVSPLARGLADIIKEQYKSRRNQS